MAWIFYITDVPVCDQRLIYAGQQLKAGSLQGNRLSTESTIMLMLRMGPVCGSLSYAWADVSIAGNAPW